MPQHLFLLCFGSLCIRPIFHEARNRCGHSGLVFALLRFPPCHQRLRRIARWVVAGLGTNTVPVHGAAKLSQRKTVHLFVCGDSQLGRIHFQLHPFARFGKLAHVHALGRVGFAPVDGVVVAPDRAV